MLVRRNESCSEMSRMEPHTVRGSLSTKLENICPKLVSSGRPTSPPRVMHDPFSFTSHRSFGTRVSPCPDTGRRGKCFAGAFVSISMLYHRTSTLAQPPSIPRTRYMPPPGMNFDTYFLAFSRLARRSVLFWGHAITSGISAFDAIAASRSADSRHRELNAAASGGIDYFVSSWLFENQELGRLAQRKYSER